MRAGRSRWLPASTFLGLVLGLPALAQPTIFKLQTRPLVAGAEVLVDGRSAGVTNAEGAVFASLEPGSHAVRVVAGGAVLADQVHDFDGELNHVRIDVKPRRVKVLIDADVQGATVSVDGRVMATTASDGRALIELPGGTLYTLRVEKAGYRELVRRVELADIDHVLSATLTPLPVEPTPPPAPAALQRAADAFFRGDYSRVLDLLEGERFTDRRAEAEAELFRAAARHSLYLLGEERDATLLAAAATAVGRCRALAPSLTPDREAFSPLFVAFFAQPH